MRFSPLVLALGLATSTVSIPAAGQRPDNQLAPRSIEFADRGEAALAAGTVVAADAIKQKLFGQAIRMTNKALALEPTDRDALAIQGEAMVDAGAVPRARDTLSKLQKLCAGPCPQAATLSAIIARGPALAEVGKPAPVKKIN